MLAEAQRPYFRGLNKFMVNCESLLRIELQGLNDLQQLTIVAPALEHLRVEHCFYGSQDQPVADILAPQLKYLEWMAPYDPSSVHLGLLWLVRGHYGAAVWIAIESTGSGAYKAMIVRDGDKACGTYNILGSLPSKHSNPVQHLHFTERFEGLPHQYLR
ncbi:hypothetical protein PR202_ga28293 [Eleusine coracana subsp. coracana]|uniref:Uncharacterized protein n=1 Tax=Eleusine coracana subsp. coracana TaxID=191504 RepID=A0AAV5DIF4_ELECO|nr:hypothetical protein PR202_ga28293 [Eleusine coracana subsp. coracana]